MPDALELRLTLPAELGPAAVVLADWLHRFASVPVLPI
jgi:hypothetical protein